MDQKIKLFAKSLGEERIKLNESLKFYTFSSSQGLAEALYVATNQRELIRALEVASDLKLNFLVIGAGTKISIDNPYSGLIIKNRTSNIKVAGIKGKFDKGSLGLSEMYVESDSGVTLNALNEFLNKNNLQDVQGYSSLHSTVGGAIFVDVALGQVTKSIKVWQDNEILSVDLSSLSRNRQIVLSVIFSFKAKSSHG